MKNSYDDAASGDVPCHLFEWAVDDETAPCDVASKLVRETTDKKREFLREQKKSVEQLNEMSDFCTNVVEKLEEAGFNADFELLSEGRVKISFEDDTDRYDRRRMRIAENIVGKLAIGASGKITKVNIMEHAIGGDITVGLTAGVGFSNAMNLGLDPQFDPFQQRSYKFVNELDVSLDQGTMDRIDELTAMWNGDYRTYNESVELTLREMSEPQRETLSSWIRTQVKRIGIPGSQLEEVLHDMHRRISSDRS